MQATRNLDAQLINVDFQQCRKIDEKKLSFNTKRLRLGNIMIMTIGIF